MITNVDMLTKQECKLKLFFKLKIILIENTFVWKKYIKKYTIGLQGIDEYDK